MKKLFISIFTAVFALFALGTSTFAWFSMNDEVTATGMAVKAQTASAFLQIVAGSDSFSETAAQTTASAEVPSALALEPTAVYSEFDEEAPTPYDGTNTIVFVSAHSNDPAQSAKYGEYKDVTTDATGAGAEGTNKYTLINSFSVRLNPTAGTNRIEDLIVSSLIITPAADGEVGEDDAAALLSSVRVLLVCGSNSMIYANNTAKQAGSADVLADEVTTEATEILVYIYFDGDQAATTTNQASISKNYKYNVEIKFAVGRE